MAKAMAKIEDGNVVNIEWVSDKTSESDTIKNIDDRHIEVGDTYADGHYYRNGNMIMSTAEKLADAEQALAIMMGGATV